MTRLEWTDRAVADLDNIHDYIARDSADYAHAVVERLILSVERLKSFPESGRHVPETPNPKVREIIVSGYRIVYRLKAGRAQILAVIHSARSLVGMKPKPWDAK
ncbi:MAG TPA: type II toxin-antitoxin system RelE/ParE family toxin [Nitrospiraceae bacterium]|jgi:addiction module RelE/StbE family toxin|nr:type II toxin-antitoxin system RelE/ParE family toxin [Nitrospiraceae bacterium]